MPLNVIIEQEVMKLGQYALNVQSGEEFPSGKHTYYIGHPEDILNKCTNLMDVSKNFDKTFVVADEGHCILEWGEDFRPDYRLISNLRVHLFSSVRMLSCTATASKEAQNAIAHCLGMTDFILINTIPVINDNVTLNVFKRIPSTSGHHSVEEAYNFVYKPLILELHKMKMDFPITIVYCKLHWCAYGVSLARRLLEPDFDICGETSSDVKYSVVQYHAHQPKEVNQMIIHTMSLEHSPIRLIFATVALGMGCDLQYVRRIYHAGVPSSLEAYTQEIGRAGRRGLQSEAVMMYNATDLAQKHVPKSLKDFCRENTCRRKLLSLYFNSPFNTSFCYDICLNTEQSTSLLTLPSLEKRQMFRDVLLQYKLTDISGDTAPILSDHMIMFLSETYEFVEGFQDTFHIPQCIAESIMKIKSHI